MDSDPSTKSNNQNSFKEFRTNIQMPRCSRLNFDKLGSDSLRRYLSHFHLVRMGSVNPTLSNEQMAKIVQRHFVSQEVEEVEVIVEFVRAAKRLRRSRE